MRAHRNDGGSHFGGCAPRARGPASLLAILALVGGCTRNGADERRFGEVANELRVCPSESTVPGIDVSVYQGRIDWDRVASSGVGFGIARIGDGLVRDDATFDANWSSMKAAGLVRGAYQYFEASEDPEAEADRVVAKVGRLGPGDLPVALDLETDDGEPPEEILRRAELWIARVMLGTGKNPLVYTAKYFWDGIPGGDALGSLPLWVAHFGVACPDLPGAWDRWRLWQNGDTSAIPGVSASVDHDVFDGTRGDLLAFAGASPSAAAGGKAPEDSGAAAHADAGTAPPFPDGGGDDAASTGATNAGEPSPDGAVPPSTDARARAGPAPSVDASGMGGSARAPRGSSATTGAGGVHDAGASILAPAEARRPSCVTASDGSDGSDGSSLSRCESPCGEMAADDRDAGCACHLTPPAHRGGSGASTALAVLAIVALGRRQGRSARPRPNAATSPRARATLAM